MSGAVVLACSIAGAAYAKLPLNDEQKAKAAEVKVISEEAATRDSGLLAKAQDRVAEHCKRIKAVAAKH
jgi:hypothetical protein